MSKEPLIDLDLGSNGILKLSSIEDLQKFLHDERQFWAWLSTEPVRGSIKAPWSTIAQHFSQINVHVSQLGDGSDGSKIVPVAQTILLAFRNARIPLSNSPVGQFIEDLRSESALSAAAALASWMNVGVSFSNFEYIKGAVLMAAFDAQITKRATPAVKRSLEDLQRRLEEARIKAETETSEQRSAFSRERLTHRKLIARLVRQSRRRMIAFRNTKADELDAIAKETAAKSDAALEIMNETEALYREHMRLKGPVEYWSQKASSHRQTTTKYRNILLAFSTVGGTALITSLYCIATRAIEVATMEKPAAVYLVLVTLGVVITTIAFWVARILTRLFLSEHHLAIDAEERSVMAQTYLALSAEGQATEQERGIVLGALFRPTADGIVKDDAAPDLSPAALISRFGAR